MKIVVFSGFLSIALLSLPLKAQKFFDIYSFTVPDNYSQENVEQSLILSDPEGRVSFVLNPVKPASDIPYVEFGNDWSQFITSQYSVLGFPKRVTTGFPGGWEMTTGQAKIFNDKVTLWAQVRSFTRQGRKATIVIFAIDDKQQELINEFMKSLSLTEADVTSDINPSVNRETTAADKSQPDTKETIGNAGVTVEREAVQVQESDGQMGYGNFKFRIPEGWIHKESPKFLELFPKSVKDGEIFSIILMKGKISSASLEDELAVLWDEFATMMGAQKLNQVSGKNFNVEDSGMTMAGWEYIYGRGDIRSSGDYFVHSYVIRAKERIERVIVLSKTISLDAVRNNIDPTVHHYPYYLTITDFVFNLRFSNLTSPVLPAASAKGAGITGCWAGIGFMGGKLKTTFMIFFSNGQVYYGSRFPITGLYGLNTYADSERIKSYWGTYTFSNGKGEAKIRGSNFPVRIESGKLIVAPISEEHTYIRLPEVDNAVLDGTWMITGENDIPCFITFRKDGTFTDKGALKVLDHSLYQYYSIAEGGGSGKYAIKDHTIIFTYSDGRVLHIVFPGLEFDPSDPSPATLCLSFNQDYLVKQ